MKGKGRKGRDMPGEKKRYPVSDETLLAYVDGELEPTAMAWVERCLAEDDDLRARLEQLRAGGRDLAKAYRLLLDRAPLERLEAGLSALLAGEREARAVRPARRPALAAAAAILLFLAGAAVDRLLVSPWPDRIGQDDAGHAKIWRDAVAEYISLYRSETFALVPHDPDQRARELAMLGARFDLALTPARIALPGARLKRAQLLGYGDAALGQIVFLDSQGRILAFCILAESGADAAPAGEERYGKRIVFWKSRGKAFMVIGDLPESRLREYAARLHRNLSG